MHLVPIIGVCSRIVIDRERFSIGRNPICNANIPMSEISSRHMCITRSLRADDGLYDIFIEDSSTNGTYLDGVAVGRSCRKQLFHMSELTLGRRFSPKRGLPNVASFIRWAFGGKALATAHARDLERLLLRSSVASISPLSNIVSKNSEEDGMKDIQSNNCSLESSQGHLKSEHLQTEKICHQMLKITKTTSNHPM